MLAQFKLPDVGEGLTEGEILQWLVAVGDTVTTNQPLCEVETAKAAVELPSPYAGVVVELLYEPGTTVDVGSPIITIDTGGTQDGGTPDGDTPAAGLIGGPAPGGRTSVLVGYGPRNTEAVRRPRRSGAGVAERAVAPQAVPQTGQSNAPQLVPEAGQGAAPQLVPEAGQGTAPQVVPEAGQSNAPQVMPEADYGSETGSGNRPALLATAPDMTSKPVRHGGLEIGRAAEQHAAATPEPDAAPTRSVAPGRGPARPLAKPPVRKYAKDLGVDLTTVTGRGPGGVITRDDVLAVHEERGIERLDPPILEPGSDGSIQLPGGRSALSPGEAPGDQRIPIKGVRKHTAAAMVASAFTAPHVTEFLTVDVTRTMALLTRLAARPELAGLKISPLLFVAKALLLAARRHPMINSSWDEAAQEIVVHGAVNLGIAAATPRGLVVPNVKDAGRLSLAELAQALTDLTTTARTGKTPPADMAGGTITITNVGVFGVDTGTPILNPGESAILAFGAVREMPWVHKGKIRVRQVTQLALSFDHRIVDGELGSRFLADIGAVLQDPGVALAL